MSMYLQYPVYVTVEGRLVSLIKSGDGVFHNSSPVRLDGACGDTGCGNNRFSGSDKPIFPMDEIVEEHW